MARARRSAGGDEARPPLMSFDEVLTSAGDGRKLLLLGNGFSRACFDDIFSYASLLESSDFSGLSPSARSAFKVLNTTDFETVMRSLDAAAKLLRHYAPKLQATAKRMERDSRGLKDLLVGTLAAKHPDRPDVVTAERYKACKDFLSHFDAIYTLNYDLLLYWALMRTEIEPLIKCDDGFRTPETGKEDYVTWEPFERYDQNIHYLHGGLHLFDTGDEIQKFTWINTGKRLIHQVRDAMASGKYPLFVAEGETRQKISRIRHSDYLDKALRSFAATSSPLIIYGWSLGDSDGHIVRRIRRGKMPSVFISIFGEPNAPHNREIMLRGRNLTQGRSARHPLDVHFFDAASARVWG